MAFQKREHHRKWDAEAERCGRKFQLIDHLKAERTPESRKALKAMMEIRVSYAAPTAGAAWNPKGKRVARGSSNKCDRINRGHRAKLNQGKGI